MIKKVVAFDKMLKDAPVLKPGSSHKKSPISEQLLPYKSHFVSWSIRTQIAPMIYATITFRKPLSKIFQCVSKF